MRHPDPEFMPNPFGQVLAAVGDCANEWPEPTLGNLPQITFAAIPILMVFVCVGLLYPLGYVLVVVDFLGKLIRFSVRQAGEQSNPIQAVSYVIAVGIYCAFWLAFVAPLSPLLLVGLASKIEVPTREPKSGARQWVMPNPFSKMIGALLRQLERLNWIWPHTVPSLIAAPILGLVTAVTIVCWPIGMCVVALWMLSEMIVYLWQRLPYRSSVLETVPTAMATGLLGVAWCIYLLPCIPFLMVGYFVSSDWASSPIPNDDASGAIYGRAATSAIGICLVFALCFGLLPALVSSTYSAELMADLRSETISRAEAATAELERRVRENEESAPWASETRQLRIGVVDSNSVVLVPKSQVDAPRLTYDEAWYRRMQATDASDIVGEDRARLMSLKYAVLVETLSYRAPELSSDGFRGGKWTARITIKHVKTSNSLRVLEVNAGNSDTVDSVNRETVQDALTADLTKHLHDAIVEAIQPYCIQCQLPAPNRERGKGLNETGDR